MSFANIFSSLWLVFSFSYAEHKFFILVKSNLLVLSFVDIISKKKLPNSRSSRFSHMLSSRSFIVCVLCLGQWYLGDKCFWKGTRFVPWFFLSFSLCVCGCVVIHVPFVKKTIFGPLLLILYQRSANYVGLILGSLFCPTVLSTISHCLAYLITFTLMISKSNCMLIHLFSWCMLNTCFVRGTVFGTWNTIWKIKVIYSLWLFSC